MAEGEIAQQKINKYLQDLRSALSSLPSEHVRDIVEELRGHIAEKANANMTSAGVDSVLGDLGSAQDLAGLYLADDLQVRALVSRSPLLILRSMFRWASLSFSGFFVLIGSLVGYFLAAVLVSCALLKPIHSRTAGLWIIPDSTDPYSFSLRLGFDSVPPGSRDVLGWWIVPIGLVVGFGLFLLTARFGLWSIRRFRAARPMTSYGYREGI